MDLNIQIINTHTEGESVFVWKEGERLDGAGRIESYLITCTIYAPGQEHGETIFTERVEPRPPIPIPKPRISIEYMFEGPAKRYKIMYVHLFSDELPNPGKDEKYEKFSQSFLIRSPNEDPKEAWIIDSSVYFLEDAWMTLPQIVEAIQEWWEE